MPTVQQETVLGALRIILYKLYYVEKSEAVPVLGDDFIEKLRTEYEEPEIAAMAQGLLWASNHPKYGFSSLLPNLPLEDSDIYNYLRMVKERFAAAGLISNTEVSSGTAVEESLAPIRGGGAAAVGGEK